MSESTKRRTRRSQTEWQRLINEQTNSGQTQAAILVKGDLARRRLAGS